MTICITALCENGAAIVAAADRQVTVPSLALEVERPKSKIAVLGVNQLLMGAGDGLVAHHLTQTVEAAARSGVHVEEVATLLHANYMTMRSRRVQEQALAPMGYTWQTFVQDGLKQLGQLYPNILQQVSQFNLGTEFLLGGFTETGAAKIAHIGHPGALQWVDGLEFFAIGSGANHAFAGLLLTGFSSLDPIERVLVSVYRAKRAAELAPGVGNATDMFIARRDGTWRSTPELLQELQALHEKAVDRERRTDDCGKVKEIIDAASKSARNH